jgi:hypothetical protein
MRACLAFAFLFALFAFGCPSTEQMPFIFGLVIALLSFVTLILICTMVSVTILKLAEQKQNAKIKQDTEKAEKDFLKLALAYGANSCDKALKAKLSEVVRNQVIK